MQINITGHHLELSPALNEYARRRIHAAAEADVPLLDHTHVTRQRGDRDDGILGRMIHDDPLERARRHRGRERALRIQ